MRFGLVTPIVTRHPAQRRRLDGGRRPRGDGARSPSRPTASASTTSPAASTSRSRRRAAASRGARYYDPLATFGFLAAQTTRIRFVTHVLVLGYHHPLAIAKRYGTLDRLSRRPARPRRRRRHARRRSSRCSAREFAGRGPRYEDALRALRAAFGRREPALRRHALPLRRRRRRPVRRAGATCPIWLGGRTPRSLRRALELGDGWDPVRARPRAARRDDRRRARARRAGGSGRGPSTSCCRSTAARSDRRGRAARSSSIARERYRDLGTTILNLRIRHRSLDHYLEQLEALAREVMPLLA